MRTSGERGMTLIELIVVIAVMGIIVPVISASIVMGLQTAEGTADKVSLSHDAKLTGIYAVPDIQSAANVSIGSSTCTTATGTKIISFDWQEEAVAVVVSYVADATKHHLVRTICRDAIQQNDQTVVLANNLSDSAVVAACSPNCGTAQRSVTLDVEVCGRMPTGPMVGTCRSGTTYAYHISARSRTQ